MKTWIALFRGINVGGNNILPMKSLTALLLKLGYTDVQTYIQSGNAVLRSAQNHIEIERKIAAAILKAHGFTPRVLLLSVNDLQKAIAANPFPHAEGNHKSLHLFFLAAPASNANLAGLDNLKGAGESYVLTKQVFYLHAPDGVGKSKLAARVERLLGVDATARNWQTVCKVRDLASA